MRSDVLEAMAEELRARAADPLASFTTWDDGRRRLDGMAKGRRWDIDREQREFEKLNVDIEKLAHKRRNERWRKRHPEAKAAQGEAWRRRNWETYLASARKLNAKLYVRHRTKRVASRRARYEAKRLAETGKVPRRYIAHCGLCGAIGHNRKTCGR